MTAVEVIGLVKTYPAHRRMREALRHPFRQPQIKVLDGLSLSLESGEVLGVLGANGAGKTTLLKIIAGVVAPTAGRVLVEGLDLEAGRHTARAKVSYCFAEERSFYWRLTGRENLEFFAALDDLHGAAAKSSINELVDRLRLAEYIDRPFSHYSSGIRQRVALARSLLRSPQVLLLDEPTRSVDPVEARTIWRLLRDEFVLKRGLAIVLVTHQPSEAIAVCDRVARLEGGRLTACTSDRDARGEQGPGRLETLEITLNGLQPRDLLRLQSLRGICDLKYSELGSRQTLEIWSANVDLVLPGLMAALAFSGAEVQSLLRSRHLQAEASQLVRTAVNAG
jgi:ABC-2 type transport system ATP-binding protein